MNYVIEGELIDTYGGNFTYRDVWYDVEDGEYIFTEMIRKQGERPETRIMSIGEGDGDEITEFIREIENK